MPRFRYLIPITVTILVVCVAVSGWRAVTGALEREATHQAYIRVLHGLTEHLGDATSEWPKNWDELIGICPELEAHKLEDLRKRVFIDFSLTRAQVADMDVATFTAVRPIPPHFGLEEDRIEALLRTVRLAPGSHP